MLLILGLSFGQDITYKKGPLVIDCSFCLERTYFEKPSVVQEVFSGVEVRSLSENPIQLQYPVLMQATAGVVTLTGGQGRKAVFPIGIVSNYATVSDLFDDLVDCLFKTTGTGAGDIVTGIDLSNGVFTLTTDQGTFTTNIQGDEVVTSGAITIGPTTYPAGTPIENVFIAISNTYVDAITVNAGTTADATDNALGEATLTNGDAIHFWSGDGTLQFTITPGSVVVDAEVVLSTDPNNIIMIDPSGGILVDGSALGDADADPNNEIQNLESVLNEGTNANGNRIQNLSTLSFRDENSDSGSWTISENANGDFVADFSGSAGTDFEFDPNGPDSPEDVVRFQDLGAFGTTSFYGLSDTPSGSSGVGSIYEEDGLGNLVPKSFTQGSVIYADTDGGLHEDNSNLYYNESSRRFGVNQNGAPSAQLGVGDWNHDSYLVDFRRGSSDGNYHYAFSKSANFEYQGPGIPENDGGRTAQLEFFSGRGTVWGSFSNVSPGDVTGRIYFGHQFSGNREWGSWEGVSQAATQGDFVFRTALPSDAYVFRMNGDQTLESQGYGAGTKEASDLGKTASSYLNGFATDGTFIEIEGDNIQVTDPTTGSNNSLASTLSNLSTGALYTEGSVLFADSGGNIAEDNANFHFDIPNSTLSVGEIPENINRYPWAGANSLGASFLGVNNVANFQPALALYNSGVNTFNSSYFVGKGNGGGIQKVVTTDNGFGLNYIVRSDGPFPAPGSVSSEAAAMVFFAQDNDARGDLVTQRPAFSFVNGSTGSGADHAINHVLEIGTGISTAVGVGNQTGGNYVTAPPYGTGRDNYTDFAPNNIAYYNDFGTLGRTQSDSLHVTNPETGGQEPIKNVLEDISQEQYTINSTLITMKTIVLYDGSITAGGSVRVTPPADIYTTGIGIPYLWNAKGSMIAGGAGVNSWQITSGSGGVFDIVYDFSTNEFVISNNDAATGAVHLLLEYATE